jgi:hypothetical protein
MCGRITQRSGELPGLVTVEGYGDSRVKDPRDVPFPSELMRIWPISTRVNKPANDDEGILEPVELKDDSALLWG